MSNSLKSFGPWLGLVCALAVAPVAAQESGTASGGGTIIAMRATPSSDEQRVSFRPKYSFAYVEGQGADRGDQRGAHPAGLGPSRPPGQTDPPGGPDQPGQAQAQAQPGQAPGEPEGPGGQASALRLRLLARSSSHAILLLMPPSLRADHRR